MEHHGGIAGGFRPVQHGEVGDRAALLDGVIGKGHIFRRQRLTIRKGHVIPEGDRPGEAVVADGIAGGQVIADGQIRIGDGKGALNERFVHMLARPPAVDRIKAGGRLGVDVQGDHHAVFLFLRCRLGGGGAAPGAAGQQSTAQKGAKDFFHLSISRYT